jgi:hypothetical protein
VTLGGPDADAVAASAEALERLRPICRALPEVEERLSHGEPAWFVGGKRLFVTFADRHHDDRVACWCAAAPGVQEALATQRPDHYFRPPYVGHRGWLGIYLDVDTDWDVVEALVHEAYLVVAPARLAAAAERGGGASRSATASAAAKSPRSR